jgi:hypothetical protein
VYINEAVRDELARDVEPCIRRNANLLALAGRLVTNGDGEEEPAWVHRGEECWKGASGNLLGLLEDVT